MARRQRRSDLDESTYPPPPRDEPKAGAAHADPVPVRRSRRLVRRIVAVVALLIIVVGLAPQIVCRTPLLGTLIAWGTADLQGSVSIGDAGVGWFSVPRIAHVELVDDDGATVLRAAEVTGDRTLWQLATAPTRLGRFRIDRPEIELELRADGTTNLEHVLQKFLTKQDDDAAATPVDVAVQIVDGVFNIHDRATNRRWKIDRVNAVVVVPSDASSPTVGDLQGSIVMPDGPRRLSAQGSWRMAPGASGTAAPQGDAAVAIESVPLELVEAFTRRYLPGLTLAGSAHGDLRARFDLAAAQPIGDASGRITMLNPIIGGSLLQGDEVRLARLDVPLRVVVEGNRLQLDEFSAVCELATLDVRGSLDRYQRAADVDGLSGLVNLLVECDGRASAKFDLARIAQSMPHVLRVRDDVQITGGELTLTALSGGQSGERRQQLELTSSGLAAQRNNVPIVWDQPIRAVATLRDGVGGPTVERIECLSEFLTVNGTNQPELFELTAQYDLAKLAARLSQFVDLGTMQLRGTGTAQGAWVRRPAQRFEIEGQATVNDFALIMPDVTWSEQQLVLGLEAEGSTEGMSVAALDSAAIGIRSAGDELTIRLTQPVVDVRRTDAVWPLSIVGTGELATWLARVRPFAGLPPTAVAQGRVDLNAAARLRLPSDVEVVSSRLTAQPFRLAAYGMIIDEPTADLQMIGRYSPTETSIREATFTSPGLQSQVRQFTYRNGSGGNGSQLSGDAAVRAELAKLAGLFGVATTGGMQYSGLLEGGARLQAADGVTHAAIDATIKSFSLSQPGGAAWQEPLVKLTGTGVYDPQTDAVAFDRLELNADALRVLLAGRVSQVSSARVIDCKGEATYDLARMTPLVQSYMGTGVALAGRETQRFELVGPLADPTRDGAIPWDKLGGTARVGWQAANLYGFQIGRGTVDAKLAQGLLRSSLLDAPVNSGRLRIAPSLRVAGGPMELTVDPGTIIERVSITPEMANERLKYVLPILSGVAQVGGQFSVALDELKLPLDNPSAGVITGRMTVHAVDVGPGILTQELATLLQQPLTASLTRESVVDFKMIQGRIYHQGLEFAFPDVKVRTHGSVGLDQSLSLVAETTVPAKLLGGKQLGAALSAQTIRIPIAGTLQRPQLDSQALRTATTQMLQNAAQGAVEQGINRGLDRLFGSGALAPQPGTTTK